MGQVVKDNIKLDIQGTDRRLEFRKHERFDKWSAKFKGVGQEYCFTIRENNGLYHFSHDRYPIDPRDQEIINFFIAQIDKLNEDYQASRLEGVEDVAKDEESPEIPDEERNPYNPEKIRVVTKNFSIAQVFEMMTEDGEIDLSPDFQRQFVWLTAERKSRLIESIMLKIPLPVFYFSELENGNMQVIDGVQRLTVIKQFLSGEFKLSKLEYLEKFNGKYYPSKNGKGERELLEPKFVRRIKQAQLTINIIESSSPAKVKYDIFKRLNSGGVQLNSQEIRNCMANSSVRKFVKDLAQSQEFKEATCDSVNDTRMAAQKLVMRFIGFYYLRVKKRENFKYLSDIEDFLNRTLDIFNNSSEGERAEIEKAFKNAMKNARYLFGNNAFRKIRKALINKSLFTTWSVFLSEYSPDDIEERFEREGLVKPLEEELAKEKDYYDATSLGTNSKKKLDKAFEIAEEIFNKERR